jgi:iron complex outermembrane receptor protein
MPKRLENGRGLSALQEDIMRKTSLLAFASSLATLAACATAAQAQAQAQAQGSAAVVEEAQADGTGAGDAIIVTARRREENLQDVPISITAVSGEVLAQRGVRDALDLQYQTPSLSVTGTGPNKYNVAYAIRGQRSGEFQLLTDPAVGTYFAEVVVPRTYGFGTAFYDLQNIQVLKGVQGTLFGRNMTGGAVLVEPNHPDVHEFHASGSAQYGNFDMVELNGMVNVPLVPDVLAVRAAGTYRDRKGYTTDVSTGRDYDDQHYYAYRVSAELQIDGLTSFLVFDYLNQDEHGSGNKLLGYTQTDPINGATTYVGGQTQAAGFFPSVNGVPVQRLDTLFNGALALGDRQVNYGNFGSGPLYVPGFGLPQVKITNWGITNKTTFEAGDVTFKNIFGYREASLDLKADLDGGPAALIQADQFAEPRQLSEELQMQGTPFGKNFDLTMGAYYFREWGKDGLLASNFPQLTAIGFATAPGTSPADAGFYLSQPAQFYRQNTTADTNATSWAVYAAGTLRVGEQFSLSGGIRYNSDVRRVTWNPFYTDLTFPGTPVVAPCYWNGPATFTRAACPHSGKLKNDAVTWDVTAQWRPTGDLSAYLSARKGYRAGGYSLRATTDTTAAPFQPEYVQEYEAGLKNSFDIPGGRLSTSIAVFFQNYTNVQKQNAISIGGQVATIIKNTAKQHNYGGEFEATLRLDNGLSANIFYSYVKDKVISGSNGTFPMQGIPSHQLGGGLTCERETGLGVVSANVNATYRSDVQLDEFDVLGLQKGYALVNARLGLDDINGTGIGVAVWGKNLTNHYYKTGVISLMSSGPILNGVNPGPGVGFGAGIFGEPRTYGVEVSFKF